ncbi:tetratricopeptide repeat protein [Sandaracinus amylolyticus]|uniref:tetratricopeptide repeat protein n=1 Tax=Sandaracinus amylolyticus TaxID=927083 RepID=UPI001F2AA3BF|nr:tetratricopeptide repeat protein [Sandaracinus amylolyticus]UJR80917.1 Hypothetical protein I5071_29680 [Sandaracinus amylolyticus]
MPEDSTPPKAPPYARLPIDPGGDVGWDEDFLFHLSRGSELLLENRVVEAKEQLERALAYRPADAKGQDLLAGVYFRLGVYPRAIELWRGLVRTFPRDATLRVNLGLALFKTGQPEDALDHVRRALEIEPEHARAWGYVGLIKWRLGKLQEARDAFARGGQASMARRMEELVASSSGVLDVPPSEVRADDREVTEVRTTADAAIGRLGDDRSLVLETPREAAHERKATGQWRVHEAGADAIPRSAHPTRPTPVDAPMTLASLLDWWAPSVPSGEPLVVSSSGALLLSTEGALHARETGVRLVRGTPTSAPVTRRFRRPTDERLGDEEPILRWQGPLLAVITARAGERFQALRIDEDVLYVVERFVAAFDDRVTFESGRLPEHAGGGRLALFRGTGTLVLRLPRPPTAVSVRSGEDVRVAPESLLGWTGRLFPLDEAVRDPQGDAILALRGDGTMLLV